MNLSILGITFANLFISLILPLQCSIKLQPACRALIAFSSRPCFNDFIDITKGLIKLGYGDSDRVYAGGGSAGGLLLGAVINMEPNLYRGIISNVPFVDIITTMSDPSIPLTTGEYSEWGNPTNKEEFDYMLSYSPYDNIEAKD